MIPNPDRELFLKVLADVKANDGYCPCMIEKDEDTKCMCKVAREEGICVCGLYVKKNVEIEKNR